MMGVSRWKIGLVVAATVLGLLFSLPNFLPESVLRSVPFLPKQTLNLGLDLRGGSSLKMEVDQDALIAQETNDLVENVRTTLRDKGIAFTNLNASGTTVSFRVTDPARINEAVTLITRMTAPVQAGVPSQVSISRGNDQLVSARLTQDYLNYALSEAVSSSIEVIRKRVDAMGTKEVTIIRQGQARIMVEAPGESDPEALKRVIGQTARLTFQMVDDSVSPSDIAAGRIPPGSEVLPFADEMEGTIVVRRRVVVSGEHLTGAFVEADQNGRPAIGFQFNADGARRFGDTTIHNQGKLFAIILDGRVMSAPRIQSPITGGRGQITGNFTATSATELVNVLKGGALRVPLRFEEQRTVGAELGADAVAKGEISVAVAFGLVLTFMVLAYGGLFGGISIVALIVNLLMLIGGMSLMQSTLTLPGIAGLILTLAMAVDANVLIYERMRDEVRSGKPLINSLDAGFSRAMETIIDANVTTLVAAAIMYFLGAGPVRGFAVTLTIGVFTSVFTAVLVTQVLVAWWYKARRPKTLPISERSSPKSWPLIKVLPEKTNFSFVKYAKAAGIVSVFLSVASLVLAMMPFAPPCGGLNCGIDFKGGSSLDMRLPGQQLDLGLLRDRLGDAGLNGVQVQAIENGTGAAIRFETPSGSNPTAKVDQVKAELLSDFPNASFGRTEVVGAKVSGELMLGGVTALLLAIFLMMLYIWFRFEWQFGLGAVVGLFHDVILTFGLFALFKLQFDLNAVAALLTIIGYSMNDTVVVFDRLRENLRKYKKMPLKEVIDQTINETLSRTIITGVTTILALGALALLGGEALFGFSIAVMFGITVGTYSSIYVAAPVILLWGVNRNQGEAEVVDVGGFKGSKPAQPPRP